MNKYSKRALKTTATVGMSLAMVLSAAAPVAAAVVTCKTTTESLEEAKCGRSSYIAIADAIGDTAWAEVNMDSDIKVKVNGTKVNVIRAIYELDKELAAFMNDGSSTGEFSTMKKWRDTTKSIVTLFGTNFATESDLGDLPGVVKTIDDKTYGVDNEGNFTAVARTEAKADLKLLTDEKAAYDHMSSDLQGYYDDAKYKVEDVLGSAITDQDKELALFFEAFDKVLQNDLDKKDTVIKTGTAANDFSEITGYEKGIDGSILVEAVTLTSKSAIKGRMQKIKDADNYDTFKDEELVTSLLDAYQEVLDNIENVTDIAKAESYVTYIKTKTDDADKTVKSYLMGFTNVKGRLLADGSVTGVTKSLKDEAKVVAKDIDNEQFAILKALKEDVLESVWNFETKEVGNYYSDKSNFNGYVPSAQKSLIINNLPGFLFKVVDTSTGEFGYDYVETHMTDFNAALNAVTKDIEKITPANIKAADKAKLEVAEDAIYELTADKGAYLNNLTDKEARTVRAAEKKVEGLREAFDKLGTSTVAAWYDMGNGNWGYNNEDGTPAAYKWVAAGSDWYFVRDGKMARNTWLAANSTDWYYLGNDGKMATSVSVDGCWINSLGIYRK